MCVPYNIANRNRTIVLKQARHLHGSVESSRSPQILNISKISEDIILEFTLQINIFYFLRGFIPDSCFF